MTGLAPVDLKELARGAFRDLGLSSRLEVDLVSARLDGDWDCVDGLIAEAYVNEIERLVEVHEHFNEGRHYCINIKVHRLDLTDEQIRLLLDPEIELLRHFQASYIEPWLEKRRCSRKPDIGVKGRSGGWLYLDRKVLETPHAEAYDAKLAYDEVREFRKEWDDLFEAMKEELDKKCRNRRS